MEASLLAAAHLLVIGYWLGTDLAVYYLSGFIVDARRPVPARLLATHAMLVLDMVPRTALVLTAILGLSLGTALGYLPVLQGWLGMVWLVGLAWLALTWVVYFLQRRGTGRLPGRIDFVFRLLVIAGFLWLAAASLAPGGGVAQAPWLGLKAALFAVAIAMGLVIRLQLKPFGPLFGKVAGGTATAQDEAALRRLMVQVKIPVWIIWLAVIAAAVLGRTRGLLLPG